MSTKGRKIAGGIAGLLFAWMLFLLFHGPRFTTSSHGEVRASVTCGSVIFAGWHSDGSFISDETSSFWNDQWTANVDGLPPGAREGIARDCSERRDSYLGIMTILAVPTTLLATLAVIGPQRDRRPPSYYARTTSTSESAPADE